LLWLFFLLFIHLFIHAYIVWAVSLPFPPCLRLLALVILEIGSHKLFVWAGLELLISAS
jgi:hypothetical protein